ncbi:MAG: LytTR family DNA-binding domain-containing protein [Crocinitomicaceae bacterium]|nr:LytTR family DNA-binding domain-containing protein [Crocinitomicaceae bacterium]
MTKLRALVVDDEEFARKNLTMMLEEYCPQIEVIGQASRKEQAKAIIESSHPDVVFLDIRMPSGAEGFELLEEIENKDFLVVFVTAFKDYAIRAFNASAVYYILKPIDIDELKTAVDKLVETRSTYSEDPESYSSYFESLQDLSHNLLNNKHSSRIAISHTRGLKIVEDHSITHLDASGNCTTIYFKDGSRYLDTRTLKTYENILNPNKFCRVHKSHIINLDILKEYVNEDGHFAVLEGGIRVPVARNRVTEFVKMLKES